MASDVIVARHAGFSQKLLHTASVSVIMIFRNAADFIQEAIEVCLHRLDRLDIAARGRWLDGAKHSHSRSMWSTLGKKSAILHSTIIRIRV